jgi:hypothetical protein
VSLAASAHIIEAVGARMPNALTSTPVALRGARGTRTVAALVVAFAAATPVFARAQGAKDQAAAEALFRKGRDLMAGGNYAEACPKLAESQRLDPAVGTLLNLASCYEKNDQLASAWVTYTEAATAAQKGNQRDRVKLARSKVAELEPKLPTLTIVVPAGADLPDLQVTRDGEAVGRAEWGTPIPVDGGMHVVEASAAGHTKWTAQAKVAGAAAKVTIEVQPLPAENPAATAPPASTSVPSGTAPPASTTAAATAPPPATAVPGPSPGSGQRIVAYVVGAVGLAGLATGAVLGILARTNENQADSGCFMTACTQQGLYASDNAQHFANGATIAFVSGGVLTAAAVVVYLLAPSASKTGALMLAPSVATTGAGASLRGSW